MDSLENPVVPPGQAWKNNNLTWKGLAVIGAPDEMISPLNGQKIQTVHVLSPRDLGDLFGCPAPISTSTQPQIQAFVARLCAGLKRLSPSLVEATQWETAFLPAECEEIVQGALDYVEGFRDYYEAVRAPLPASLNYNVGVARRRIELTPVPWGTVAVMLPQNALLLIGVICLVNALITRNRVVLRAPLPCARTAALLAFAIEEAKAPEGVCLVVAKGREFLEAAYASENSTLVHYLGASQFGGEILREAFDHRKPALVDGTGNVWVWASAANDPSQVAALLTEGAVRFNGQTCTSINGALIHPDIYDEVRTLLCQRWSELTSGNPLEGAQVGGLFDERQARSCLETVKRSGGQILCGGHHKRQCVGADFYPKPRLSQRFSERGNFRPRAVDPRRNTGRFRGNVAVQPLSIERRSAR